MALAQCAGLIAPYYNLALVVIIMVLFVKLFRTHTPESFSKPWYLLCAALGLFVVEEVLTVLKFVGVISYPPVINPVFEMAMVALFIYMLLIQKRHIREQY